MRRRVTLSLAATAVLLALAGCGRGFLQFGERPAWRHDEEVACLKSGSVKIGVGVEQMKPIDGPGICGADFPLKVALLGEGSAMSYGDDLRPPGAIPNADADQPRWPPLQRGYAPPPVQGERMRWVPGPPPAVRPAAEQPAPYTPAPQRAAPQAPPGQPLSIYAPGVRQPDDGPDDAVLPPGRERMQPSYQQQQPAYQRNQGAYNAPVYQPPPQRALPPLGPMRGPNATAAMTPAAVTPPATLACPMVSALDRWVSEGVQPAALHWFGTQVTEIRQIGSYSCREMVGSGTSSMSEHAFGDALDIAGFTFADGRRISVKDGWHGTPEEQGFLHDVQLYACQTFTTVLAPGYNVFHYDHIHVDLMRRRAGYRPCRPDAIPGEVVAARVRAVYARRGGAAYSSAMAKARKAPVALAGEDGYVADGDNVRRTGAEIDHDFDVDPPSRVPARRSAYAGEEAVRAEQMRARTY